MHPFRDNLPVLTPRGRLREALKDIRSAYAQARVAGRTFEGMPGPEGVSNGEFLYVVPRKDGDWVIERRDTYGRLLRTYRIDRP